MTRAVLAFALLTFGCGGIVERTSEQVTTDDGGADAVEASDAVPDASDATETDAPLDGWCLDPTSTACPAGRFTFVRCAGGGALPNDPNCVPNASNTAMCCLNEK